VTMTAALEWNLNHGQRNARLFEIGRRYRLQGNESVETTVLTLGATSEAREKGLYDSLRDFSFADLKSDLDAIGAMTNPSTSASGFQWEPGGPAWLQPAQASTISIFTNLKMRIGFASQLSRRVREQLKIKPEVFVAELDLDPCYESMELAKAARRYEQLPRFPAVERDFSLLLADGISFAQIVDSIRSLNIAEISSIEAVDLFRGKNVPAGKYSLLVRVTLQSREATLTDAQINHFVAKIISILEHRHGAQLRKS